jgi:hypothetical protein
MTWVPRACALSDVTHGALEGLRVVPEGAHAAVPQVVFDAGRAWCRRSKPFPRCQRDDDTVGHMF